MKYLRPGLKVKYIGASIEGVNAEGELTVKEVHTFYGDRSNQWFTQVEVEEIPDSAFSLHTLVPT
jgi:hypothetical protein